MPLSSALIARHLLQGLAPRDLLRRWPRDRSLMMLHSGRVHPKWARWSILTSPRGWYAFDSRSRWTSEIPSVIDDVKFTHDPLRDLDAILNATTHDSQPPHQRPPFQGGWIGYFSYDLGRLIESK